MKPLRPSICILIGLAVIVVALTVEPPPPPANLPFGKADLIREQRSERMVLVLLAGVFITFTAGAWQAKRLLRKSN